MYVYVLHTELNTHLAWSLKVQGLERPHFSKVAELYDFRHALSPGVFASSPFLVTISTVNKGEFTHTLEYNEDGRDPLVLK